MKRNSMLRRFFAVLAVSSLAFGTAQAFAAPGAQEASSWCDPYQCANWGCPDGCGPGNCVRGECECFC